MTFRTDVHLYPLYMVWAFDYFRQEELELGLKAFQLMSSAIQSVVFRKLMEIKGLSNLGVARKSFLGIDGFSSSCRTRAKVINIVVSALSEIDRREICSRIWRITEIECETRGSFEGTFETKMAAADQYAENSRVLTWVNDNEQILLVKREDGALDYVVFDEMSSNSWSRKICDFSVVDKNGRQTITSSDGAIAFSSEPSCSSGDLSSHKVISREDYISILRNCIVTVESRSDQKLSVSEYIPFMKWDSKEKEKPYVYELVERQSSEQGRLVWRLFDERTKTISWLPVNSLFYAISSVNRCLYSSVEKTSNRENDVKIREFLKLCLLNYQLIASCNSMRTYSSSVLKNCSNSSLFIKLGEIRLKKLQKRSVFDFKKIIDQDNWTVTLFCDTWLTNPLEWVGHAKIAYEGIYNGEYFAKGFHLIFDGKARVKFIEEWQNREDSITYKSETWVVCRNAVERMVAEVQREIREPNTIYDFLAVSSETDNCLTWLIRKLRSIGIMVPYRDVVTLSPQMYVDNLARHPELVKLEAPAFLSASSQLVGSSGDATDQFLLRLFVSKAFFAKVSSSSQLESV